jgi:PAS domain S-box-containing protein
MEQQMHSLLKRQLKRHFGEHLAIPEPWEKFIRVVNEAYQEFDADRAMLEHSLELSSQELLEANSEMRAVLQAIPDQLIRFDGQGAILDFKAGAMGDHLLQHKELFGNRIQDIPVKHIREQFQEAIGKVLKERAMVRIEYTLMLEDREHSYEARLVPLQENQIVAIIGNITERKRTEGALRKNEEHLRNAAQVGGVGTFEHDHVTDEIYMSPLLREIFAFEPSEEVSIPKIFQRVFVDDQKEFLAAIQSAHDPDGDGRCVREHRVVRDDGDIRWVWAVSQTSFESVGDLRRPHRTVGAVVDITKRKRAEAELQEMHRQLLDVSRRAGMAELATGILHNVGNVLNSVNIASTCVAESLRKSKAANLSKVVELFREHEQDLGDFFTNNPKSRQVPAYLAMLSKHLAGEQAGALEELAQLQKNIEHIKDIVTMQQSFAKTSGVTDVVNVTELVEEALMMDSSGLARHGVEVVKEFVSTPPVTVEKHKVLQILVNLVRNARHACEASNLQEGKLILRTATGENCVRIAVCDNGVGIPHENLNRIFSHGFTTKKEGHGFGLHSAALVAKEMGGSLAVHSDGSGEGATFTLELPLVRDPERNRTQSQNKELNPTAL